MHLCLFYAIKDLLTYYLLIFVVDCMCPISDRSINLPQVIPSSSISGSVTSSSTSSSIAVSVRVMLTSLTVVTAFTLCWVPLQTVLFLMNVGIQARSSNLVRWLTVLSCVNSCVNPIIYGLMWRPFRAALRDVSRAWHICKQMEAKLNRYCDYQLETVSYIPNSSMTHA